MTKDGERIRRGDKKKNSDILIKRRVVGMIGMKERWIKMEKAEGIPLSPSYCIQSIIGNNPSMKI